MSWTSHSKQISNKVSRVLGIMNRLKHFLPFSALRLMYQSLVNCHLQFCILAWGYESNRVYDLQKKAIRIMTANKYNAHTEPLFKQLNIIQVADSFKLHCLKFYHKFKIKSLPAFFDNIFMRNNDIHPYGTRRRDQLHFFSYKTTGASKYLRHFIPNLLNDIDPDTRRKLDTLSLDGFSSYYKSLVTPKCTQGSALVRILMQSLPANLILLISIAANEFYVYKGLWVPHAGTGPNHNTQWHSELCFSLNSLILLCLMSAYANRHA